jgi:hypothetical protein
MQRSRSQSRFGIRNFSAAIFIRDDRTLFVVCGCRRLSVAAVANVPLQPNAYANADRRSGTTHMTAMITPATQAAFQLRSNRNRQFDRVRLNVNRLLNAAQHGTRFVSDLYKTDQLTNSHLRHFVPKSPAQRSNRTFSDDPGSIRCRLRDAIATDNVGARPG